MRKLLWISLFLVACGGDDSATPVDASVPDASALDAAPPDPACGVLFLNFEPTDLTRGFENAPQNISTLIPASVTTPGFRIGDPSRDAAITAVIAQVRDVLEPFGVTVVAERPAAPPYTMAVIGGVSTDVGFQAGVWAATTFLSCDSPMKNRITFAFEEGPTSTGVGNLTLSGYLIGLGVPQSSDPRSCVCWSGVACDLDDACILSEDTARLAGQEPSCDGAPFFDAPADVRDSLAACD